MNALSNVGFFLINTFFTLYIGLVMVRFLLAASRASFYNPISQFIVQVTNPVMTPLRRIVPSLGKIDSAAILLMLTLKFIQITLLLLLQGQGISFFPLLAIAVVQLLEMLIYIYIIALIVLAVLSWVNPGAYQMQNPLVGLLNSLTAPVLKPLRKFVPSIGMVDITPLAAIILLNVALIFLRSFH